MALGFQLSLYYFWLGHFALTNVSFEALPWNGGGGGGAPNKDGGGAPNGGGGGIPNGGGGGGGGGGPEPGNLIDVILKLIIYKYY